MASIGPFFYKKKETVMILMHVTNILIVLDVLTKHTYSIYIPLVNLDSRVDTADEPVRTNKTRRARQETIHNTDHDRVGEVDQTRHKVVDRQLLGEEHHAVQKDVER